MEKEIAIFKTEKETINVEVLFEDETVWLTQEQMAQLFEKSKSTINEHIKHIFEEGELDKSMVVRNFRMTTKHGAIEGKTQTHDVFYYNLDVIISVGYRVKSLRGTQFRQWATKRLNEYIRKGFALDDNRLKQLGGEVQNKMHFAVHGQTAAEVIYNRADAEKEFMGLKSFEGSKPHLKDAVVAKNYLDEKELRALGQIVSGYLDFAERQAERQQPMTMKDWSEHLDKILTMSGEQLLQGNGSISHEKALEKATSEYKKYQQKTLSDVEKDFLDSIKEIESKAKA